MSHINQIKQIYLHLFFGSHVVTQTAECKIRLSCEEVFVTAAFKSIRVSFTKKIFELAA